MKITILILLSSLLFAKKASSECDISYNLLYSIASVEAHPKRGIGYPFLISFNKSRDSSKVRTKYKNEFIDKRSIDCGNKEKCTRIFKHVRSIGITNLDLGAFQINYNYHKIKIENYFNLSQSYKKACDILMNLKSSYGWNWNTVGKYHSFTKKRSRAYASRVYEKYININKKLLK